MKTLYSLAIALLAVCPALAQTSSDTSEPLCTVVPASGSTVDEISSLTITSTTSDAPWTFFYSAPKIEKDGAAVTGYAVTRTNGAPGVIEFTPAITAAGTYTITFSMYGISFSTEDGDNFTSPDDNIVYTYTVSGAKDVPTPVLTWAPDPAPGTVTSLSEVKFTYDTSSYSAVSVADASKVSVIKNGDAYSDVTAAEADGSVTVTLATAASEAGTYVLTFAPGAVSYTPAGATEAVTNTQALSYTYVIEGDDAFYYTTDPVSGATLLDPVSVITVNYFNCVQGSLQEGMAAQVGVAKDGQPLSETVTVANDRTAKTSTLTLSTPLSDPGTYTVTLPKQMISYFGESLQDLHYLAATTLTFTIGTVPGSLAGIEATQGEATYYTLQGTRLSAPTPGIPVIRIQAGKASKIIR